MKKIGNLLPEIVEAIHLMYEDYPDVELDCMLYLSKMLGRSADFHCINRWFEEHNRCEDCGGKLNFYIDQIVHDELEGSPVEFLNVPYCPVCEPFINK